MDKNNIKNLLAKTFVTEAKVPGLDVTNKAKSESGKENKKAIKDMEKDLSDYDKDSKKASKDATKPVKFNYTNDSEAEYHQEMEIMNGQMIQYDRTPSENFKKRAEEAIEGSSRMGNNPEWANVVVPGQGGDPTFGKKLVKAIKASEKKRNDATPTSKMFGDDWEITQDKSHKDYAFENKQNNKSKINESTKMKRLTFKKPFNGVNNALNLIPETYRVDNKVFEMTDGNESYRVRWEGSLNEGKGVVLMASDKSLVNEDIQKMKHLMGYKSQDTFGNLKGAERINEDKNFSDIWRKTKSILSENIDELTKGQEFIAGQAGDPKKIEKADFDALRARKDESIYEMDGDTGQQGPVNQTQIKGDMMSSLKQDVTKMVGNEKTVYDTLISKIGDYLAQGGNQASGSFNTLYQRLMDFIDGEMQNQSASLGESEMYEGGMYEDEMPKTDRFEEVFSGLDEMAIEEISLPKIFNFRDMISKIKMGTREVMAKFQQLDPQQKQLAFTTPLFGNKKVGDVLNMVSPSDVARLESELAGTTPEEVQAAVEYSQEGGGDINEGVLSKIFGANKSQFLARLGIPMAMLSIFSVVVVIGSTGYNTGNFDNPLFAMVHDAYDNIFGQQGSKAAAGFSMILGFGLFLCSILFSAAKWNAKK